MHLPGGFLARFGQSFYTILPVNIVQERLLAAIFPTHDKVHRAGIDAKFARHVATGISRTLRPGFRVRLVVAVPAFGKCRIGGEE